MSTESNTSIEKNYSPESIEKKWYDTWLSNNCFAPQKDFNPNKKPFSIILPPPNVTGKLHMGHALDCTTQDIITRFKRMHGHKTVWIPGTDHAGIATQAVVEKNLLEQEKISRKDLGREKFVAKVWDWKEKYGNIITEQLKSIGASLHWDNHVFTMDPKANEAVKKVFIDMYKAGLIYRSDYIVNWSPELHSAISDIEVNYKEVNGHFYYIKYQIKDTDEFLTIATTRPETLLGDTAIAINPKDSRAKNLLGKKAIVPIVNREVVIIADDYVDMDFGTGQLKVTPAHDFNDFEMGKRHNLPSINILNSNGLLNSKVPRPYEGLSTKKARVKIVEALQDLGLLIKVEPHKHQVGHCSRTGCVIEPLTSKQWFLKTDQLAHNAMEAVKNDKSKFIPKEWENTFFAWLKEPKDWCISRQLWWGHQIPVFYCKNCQAEIPSPDKPQKCSKCESQNLFQDPDVLDTWFSSALWPFVTLGWPHENEMKERSFDDFFPNTTLITGHDIIFFWVARMMMMSLYHLKKVPFEKIYIHAIVRDKWGRKMSKSLGNGIDPLDVIKEFGADSLRFSLASHSGYNRSINLDMDLIKTNRNFINKLWNAYRFISPFLELSENDIPEKSTLDTFDKWILSSLNTCVKIVNAKIDSYRFDEASSQIYNFTYEKFCSYYIELSKVALYGSDEKLKKQKATVLKYTLKNILLLLHPICPFMTEEIWNHLKSEDEKLIISSPFPEAIKNHDFPFEEKMMSSFIQLVSGARNLKSQMELSPKEEVIIQFLSDQKELCSFLDSHKETLFQLARIKELLFFTKQEDKPEQYIFIPIDSGEVYLPISDPKIMEKHVKKNVKKIEKLRKELSKLENKLNNQKFMDKAPQDVVQEVKEKCNILKSKVDALEDNLKQTKY